LIRFLDNTGRIHFGDPVFDSVSGKITSARILKGTPYNGELTDQVIKVEKVSFFFEKLFLVILFFDTETLFSYFIF